MNYVLQEEKEVNSVEKEKVDFAGVKTSMCIDKGVGNTVVWLVNYMKFGEFTNYIEE